MTITYQKVLRAGVMLAASVVAIASAGAEELVLRYNQWFPTGHWSQQGGLYKYFEEIERVTEGRVKVEPSAKPLAPPNRNYQAVVDGVVDIAWGPHGYTPGVFPLTEMVELPFITENAGISSVAYWRLWEEHFAPTGMQGDVVTLAMHVTSGGNIHMRDAAITSIADLQGKKIRVPTPVVGRVLKEIGAVPVSGTLGELQEFLARGIVDGTAISDDLLTGFKLQEHIHQATQIPGGLYSNSAFVIMNKDKWNRISPEDQEAIMAISGENLSRKMGELWHEFDGKSHAAIVEQLGDDFQVASDAFLAELEQAFAGEQDAWMKVAADAGVDGPAAWDFYNQQLAELSQ